MKKIIIMLVFSLLLSSCIEIWSCLDNEKKFKKSFEFTSQTALTVPELDYLIKSDTSRYKIVFFLVLVA